MSTSLRKNGKSKSELSTPFKNFVNAETTSGAVLLLFAIVAIILANSPLSQDAYNFWNLEFGVNFGAFSFIKPLSLWINELLMAFFFLVVGLEIKRELVVGELSSFKKALLPVVASFGGVLIPAIIFILVASGEGLSNGWAIPTSTDIAFCLAALHLFGKRVPVALKVFTVAAAIVDDLFGVIILATFYSHKLSLDVLAWSLVPLLLLFFANRLDLRKPLPYLVLGAGLWSCFMAAGVHASVVGVILAMFVPVKPVLNSQQFKTNIENYINQFYEAEEESSPEYKNRSRKSAILAIEEASVDVQSPLQRMESRIHPWVAFLILPLFALANAGVSFSALSEFHNYSSLFLAIVLGLTIGKPLGIATFSYIAIASGAAKLPRGVSFNNIIGAACLSGIGFTMSLFISGLAYTDMQLVQISRFSILVGSLIAFSFGVTILAMTLERKSCSKNKRFALDGFGSKSKIMETS